MKHTIRIAAMLLAVLAGCTAVAKNKPTITIEVRDSTTNISHTFHTIPGTAATSTTECQTTGSTSGTISDYGVGPVHTSANSNANTTCTTTTTPPTPPQTVMRSNSEEYVSAFLPDGHQLTLYGAKLDSATAANWSLAVTRRKLAALRYSERLIV